MYNPIIETLDSFPEVVIPQTYLDLSKKINDEADLFNPIDENVGTRVSDVETLESATNPVMLAKGSARMQRNFSDLDTSGMTDQQIADLVIPQGTTVADLAKILDYHKGILNTPPAVAVDTPQPAVVAEPPKTE